MSVCRTVHLPKCPFAEMSVGRNVRLPNGLFADLSVGWNVRLPNCPLGEMSVCRTVRWAKCPLGEQSVIPNAHGAKCLLKLFFKCSSLKKILILKIQIDWFCPLPLILPPPTIILLAAGLVLLILWMDHPGRFQYWSLTLMTTFYTDFDKKQRLSILICYMLV